MKYRRLLVLVLVLAGLGCWLAASFWESPRARAIAEIKERGGSVFEQETASDSGPRTEVSVTFSNQDIGDSDLLLVKELGTVHRLFLDRTKITDAGMKEVGEIEGLEWLSLTNTAIGDEGLANLKKLPGLRYLYLCGTRVTDRGLSNLQSMPHLQQVDTVGTKVTPRAASELEQSLPHLHVSTERKVDPDD